MNKNWKPTEEDHKEVEETVINNLIQRDRTYEGGN